MSADDTTRHDRDSEATSPTDVPQEDTMTNPTTSGEHTAPLGTTETTTSVAPTTPTEPTAPTAPAAPPSAPRRGPRVGTIVWGLVIAAIGAFIMAYALDVQFDEELAFIILIAAAGVLLLVGSVVTSRRRRP